MLLTKSYEADSLQAERLECPGTTAARPSSLYVQALEIIRRHAADGTTLKDILDSLQVSHDTLERHFLQQLGRTPSQELLRVRVEHARTLLLTTDFPVKTIAMMCGYRRVSNFGDFIRRQTGLSPRALRQRWASAQKLDGPSPDDSPSWKTGNAGNRMVRRNKQ
jgi:transcriptional regulator GlxA family with amidase domain